MSSDISNKTLDIKKCVLHSLNTDSHDQLRELLTRKIETYTWWGVGDPLFLIGMSISRMLRLQFAGGNI